MPAWSDFDFWVQLAKGKAEAFLFLVKNPLLIADAAMLANLAGLICASITAAAAVWKMLDQGL